MKSEVLKLEPNNATLTTFIHDDEKIREAILVFPGGAYRYCSPFEGKPVAEAFYEKGFNTFVLEYTCTDGLHGSPKAEKEEVFDSALEDAMSAYCFIQDNKDRFKLFEDKISIIGFSAGAHLALASAVLGKLRPLCLLLGYVPVTDEMMSPLGMKELYLLDKIPEDMPPVFMFLNQADSLVPSSESMKLALKLSEMKLPFEMHCYVTGDHGLVLGIKQSGVVNKDYATWFERALCFIENIQSSYPLILGDITDEVNNPSIDSRIGALMYNQKAWKLIEEILPDIAEKAVTDTYLRSKPLHTVYRWGMVSSPDQEEVDKLLKNI